MQWVKDLKAAQDALFTREEHLLLREMLLKLLTPEQAAKVQQWKNREQEEKA